MDFFDYEEGFETLGGATLPLATAAQSTMKGATSPTRLQLSLTCPLDRGDSSLLPQALVMRRQAGP
jgi:hypothetical protein